MEPIGFAAKLNAAQEKNKKLEMAPSIWLEQWEVGLPIYSNPT